MTDLTARRGTSAGLLILALATAGFALAGGHDAARTTVTVAFYLLVPGLAVIGTVGLSDAALELALGIGLSLAISIGVSEVMLWAHDWRPAFTLGLLLALSLPLLGYRVVRPLRTAATQGSPS